MSRRYFKFTPFSSWEWLERQILTEMFGWFCRRVSEEMKENIVQVRLEEVKTKVNKGEDLTCWKKGPEGSGGFSVSSEQTLEIRLWFNTKLWIPNNSRWGKTNEL